MDQQKQDVEQLYQPWLLYEENRAHGIKFDVKTAYGDCIRYESYLQAFSVDMTIDEKLMAILFPHTCSLVLIKGRGLGALLGNIIERKVISLHVCPYKPASEETPVITKITLEGGTRQPPP